MEIRSEEPNKQQLTQCFIELAMKRDQIEELHKQLDAEKLQNHELSQTLSTLKNSKEENERRLNVALKNARHFEEQWQLLRDSTARKRLQHDLLVAESKGCQKLIHEKELKNFHLTQELNELKAQHACDNAYRKELSNQETKIQAKIAQICGAMQTYQINHDRMSQLVQQLANLEEQQKKFVFYQQELFKQKQKYSELEKKFLFTNAALEVVQKLQTQYPFHFGNVFNSVTEKWEKVNDCCKKQVEMENEVIMELKSTLKMERENVYKKCMYDKNLHDKIKELEDENQQLKKKLYVERLDKSTECSEIIIIKDEIN